ncbi:hypothetical protein [Streptomyces sp. SID1034]|uniref:hypothetical protein n=1 Tax=Streptomyces sp. SID1034 TaxID=2690248 RepID=UPI001371EFC5|nr:hypothetical protein [Streptomyces sp. SID1034]
MIVTLIIACEVGFWVLLATGLALRYLAHMRRASVAVLLCEPLLEVVLLLVTAVDLKHGAQPDWKHGLAAVYIGFSAGMGHYLVTRADAWVAYRFAGGPRPSRTPRGGVARTVYEWRTAGRFTVSALLAIALLQAAIWYVGGDGSTESLRMWQGRMLIVIGINVVIALSYTLFPGKDGEPRPSLLDRFLKPPSDRPRERTAEDRTLPRRWREDRTR